MWRKHNLHILTAAGILVALYLVLSRNDMSPAQKAIGFFIVGITLHEWEEIRFPGGFFTLMTRMFDIQDITEKKISGAHGSVALAIVLFAYVPFFLSDIAWIAMVPAILGIFEAFIHLIGIKIHRLKKPYSPGMATALTCLLPASICIIAFGSSGMPAWHWTLSFTYYIGVFALMEAGVWRSFGISLKEFPSMAKKARAYAFKRQAK